MTDEILAKVFYTPVQSPEKVMLIDITNTDDLGLINSFVKDITNRKCRGSTVCGNNIDKHFWS